MASFRDWIRFRKSCCSSDISQCYECPLYALNTDGKSYCGDFMKNHTDEAEAIIDKWCKEHPTKTRQSEILKLFPNIPRRDSGEIIIRPKLLDPNITHCAYDCDRCQKNYWLGEIE